MIESNGNGSENGKKNGSTAGVAYSPITGAPLRFGPGIGGKKGRSGRKPDALRNASKAVYRAWLKWAKKQVEAANAGAAEVAPEELTKIANTAGKYGLGAPSTHDDGGPVETLVRVVREPKSFLGDN